MADDSLTGASRSASSRSDKRKSGQRRGVFAAIGLFIRQILDELSKVVRPTRSEWATYTTVVIIFVVVIMLFVFGMDTLFTKLVFWVFAGKDS
ncbi:preprotein translocase subunit SecE [Austwickia chelonae]|uniref:preprotein translocase subunit SecE n=1 Tax=Austwickia chelonae TaxID=100225 RepID=UPI001F082AD4|nr:preprotein translocase subunit SecE [Austwickia chelonae]